MKNRTSFVQLGILEDLLAHGSQALCLALGLAGQDEALPLSLCAARQPLGLSSLSIRRLSCLSLLCQTGRFLLLCPTVDPKH